MTTLNNGKALITQNPGGLHISIPSRKTWFLIVGAILWLCGWAFGLKSVLGVLLTHGQGWEEGKLFVAVWLTLWTLGGISIIGMVLWGIFGKEEFFISQPNGEVIFKKHILGLGIRRKLMKNQIKNFTFNEVPTNSLSLERRWSVWGLGQGKIKFDYGMKTFSMGLGLDDAEANYIIYLLDEKFG